MDPFIPSRQPASNLKGTISVNESVPKIFSKFFHPYTKKPKTFYCEYNYIKDYHRKTSETNIKQAKEKRKANR